MNAADELARTTSLLEELERLVATGTLTAEQLEQLEGVVLPPLFVRQRILRRAAGDWQNQATRQFELSELGWHRMPWATSRPRPSVLPLVRTITALYDDGHDYGIGPAPAPAPAKEQSSRGFELVLALGAAFWLAKGKGR